MWKVRMERWLTDGKSPEIKIKSSFDYELPADWADMLNGIDEVDEEYQQSILHGIHIHLQKKFGNSGFFAQELISP
tara:strand:+ start:329 stop:556 length:228 start_codon:yes stop_codon:yes gene_type:complete